LRSVVDAYVGIWIICLVMLLAMGFTMINLHVSNARRIMSDLKAEVQASNGAMVPMTGIYTSDRKEGYGYHYTFQIERQNILATDRELDGNSYIYNNIYKISLNYVYGVPLFGRQGYPIVEFAY